jgi:hypothetical protein
VAAQPQDRKTDDDRGQGRDKPAGYQSWQERPLHPSQEGRQIRQEMGLARRQYRHYRGDVAADRHESRMAEREQTGEAVGDVEADCENDIDAKEGDDREQIRIEDRAGAINQHRPGEGRAETATRFERRSIRPILGAAAEQAVGHDKQNHDQSREHENVR